MILDETKIDETSQKLLNKTNDLHDKKFAVMSAQIKNDINEVREDLTKYI